MVETTDIKLTKSAESETEAKVFNVTEKYLFIKFSEKVSKLLVVYIRNPDTDEYFKFAVEPEQVNNVYLQTNYYYMKFDLIPVFEKQINSVQKWLVNIYERQGNENLRIKEHIITLNKMKSKALFVFNA